MNTTCEACAAMSPLQLPTKCSATSSLASPYSPTFSSLASPRMAWQRKRIVQLETKIETMKGQQSALKIWNRLRRTFYLIDSLHVSQGGKTDGSIQMAMAELTEGQRAALTKVAARRRSALTPAAGSDSRQKDSPCSTEGSRDAMRSEGDGVNAPHDKSKVSLLRASPRWGLVSGIFTDGTLMGMQALGEMRKKRDKVYRRINELEGKLLFICVLEEEIILSWPEVHILVNGRPTRVDKRWNLWRGEAGTNQDEPEPISVEMSSAMGRICYHCASLQMAVRNLHTFSECPARKRSQAPC